MRKLNKASPQKLSFSNILFFFFFFSIYIDRLALEGDILSEISQTKKDLTKNTA